MEAKVWFNKMEIDAIKYVGGPHHITILYRNKDSKKLFVFYCYTSKPIVDIEEDCTMTTLKETVERFHKADIIIPINTYKSGVWYQLEINKEEDFDLIEKVVSSIMEGTK